MSSCHCLLSLCLFNLYVNHTVRNAGLDELQARIKEGRRSINNLRCADNTTLMAESKAELKSLWMRVQEAQQYLLGDRKEQIVKCTERHLGVTA